VDPPPWAHSDKTAPSAPSSLTKTGSTTSSVSISWTASTDNVGVAGYGVYKNGAGVGSTTSTSFTFTGLACGTNYTLGVDAYDGAGNRSAQSSVTASTSACPDTQAPTTPTGLSAGGATQTSVSLSWNASMDNVGVTGYTVYKNGSSVATTSATAYTVAGLTCGTSYTLAVDAFDAAGNHSGKASVTGATSACSSAAG